MIFNPFASARSILTKNQKDLGTVLIDVGFSVTGMAVYEEGKIIHAAVFPGRRRQYHQRSGHRSESSRGNGGADKTFIRPRPFRAGFPPRQSKSFQNRRAPKGEVSRRFISEIIEGRLAEITEFVNNELKITGKAGSPAGERSLSAGAKIPGMVEVAKQELRLPIQIGIPGPCRT